MRVYFIILFIFTFASCSSIDINHEIQTGIRQYENDSLESAIKSLSLVINTTDTCFDCYLYRGFAYKDLRQLDNALKDFNSLIRLDSNISIGFANKASIYYLKLDYPSALINFSKAYSIDSSKSYLNPICHMLFANGYEDSACIYYNELIRMGDTAIDASLKEYCSKKDYR